MSDRELQRLPVVAGLRLLVLVALLLRVALQLGLLLSGAVLLPLLLLLRVPRVRTLGGSLPQLSLVVSRWRPSDDRLHRGALLHDVASLLDVDEVDEAADDSIPLLVGMLLDVRQLLGAVALVLQDREWLALALAPLGARRLAALLHGDEDLHLSSQVGDREMSMCLLELLHLLGAQLAPVLLILFIVLLLLVVVV